VLKAGSTILTQEYWQSMAQQCPQPVQLQEISLWMPQHANWLIFCLEGKPFVLLAIHRFSIKRDVHSQNVLVEETHNISTWQCKT
jgi:hypothetical protein